MKFLLFFTSIFLFLYSCSSPEVSRRSLPYYGDPFQGVRIVDKNEKWSPENNCKMIKYVQVYGQDLQNSERGYRRALRSLSLEVRRLRGTLAQVRDYTNETIYAYVWFCSGDYSDYSK